MSNTVAGLGPSKARMTPRNSITDEEIALAEKETPYNTLHQLANIIPRPTTPLQRALSAGPPSSRRSTRRTPAIQERTPAGISLPTSLRKHDAVTPHGRAARREAEYRRAAALTPGRERHRSSVQQRRESPRDNLRILSRVLAPGSKVVEPQPQDEVYSNRKVSLIGREDDPDDEQEPLPTLSIPLGDDDEDDSLLFPSLRSAGMMDDDNLTQRSVELPRRAVTLEPIGRLQRESFGSTRASDRFQLPNDFGMDNLYGGIAESSFLQQGDFDEHNDTNIVEETTARLGRPYLDEDTGRISMVTGRTSDIRHTMLEDDTETTFVLPLPQRDALANRLGLREDDGPAKAEKTYDDPGNETVETDDNKDSEIDQVDMEDVTMQDAKNARTENLGHMSRKSRGVKKRIKVSRHGIQYPSLPVAVVKKLATTFLRRSGSGNAKLSKDTLGAIMQASDWFFEQVSDDLGIYAQHAARKTIEENDVITLMKRQRQTNATMTVFALAQRYLPRELLQDLRMAPPVMEKKGHQLKLGDDN